MGTDLIALQPAATLLAPHDARLERLRQQASCSAVQFAAVYAPLLERFAEYVQRVPCAARPECTILESRLAAAERILARRRGAILPRNAWKAEAEAPPCPWSEARIQERLQAIRAIDARAALHLELVRVFGMTHRQAGALQPGTAGRDGVLDMLWEVPKDQVLRFSVAGERQQAVLDAARHLLPDPEEVVCPPELALEAWLRRVYDLMRTVGGIGVPGEPTLRALQDRDAPTPQVLSRDAYLLARAGLKRPRSARR